MQTIDLLSTTKTQTEAYFDMPEDVLRMTNLGNGWNAKQMLVHISDVESIIQERIKKVISESDIIVWPTREDLWCRKLDYDNFPKNLSKSLYVANRDSIIYLAQKFKEDIALKGYKYEVTNTQNLTEEFINLANYNQYLLNKITIAFNFSVSNVA